MAQFLDTTGLQTLWSKVKAYRNDDVKSSMFIRSAVGRTELSCVLNYNTNIIYFLRESSDSNTVTLAISDTDGKYYMTNCIRFDDLNSNLKDYFTEYDGKISLKNDIIYGTALVGSSNTYFVSTKNTGPCVSAYAFSSVQEARAYLRQKMLDQSSLIPLSSVLVDLTGSITVKTGISSYNDSVDWVEEAPNIRHVTIHLTANSSSDPYYLSIYWDMTQDYTKANGYIIDPELTPIGSTNISYIRKVARDVDDMIYGVKARVFKVDNYYFAPNNEDDGKTLIRYFNFDDAFGKLLDNIFKDYKN